MSKLNKKVFRDIKVNKSQFINIFIMVFLGVFVFSGIHSYMDGMKYSADKYYEENNLQDLWVSGYNFSLEDLNNIKKLDNVKDAERVLTLRTDLENYEDVVIELNFIETNNVSKMYVNDGSFFDKNKSGIWLDSYLAKNLGLNVGDKITLKYNGIKLDEEIVGLINTPDHVYFVKDETAIFPTHKDFGFAYASINEFPYEAMYNQIIVDVDDENNILDVKSDIENNIKSAVAVTDRNSSFSYKGYQSEIEEGTTYSSVFTLLFLLIAILSVITTMNRFVRKERTQIGTMKALGINKHKITWHYISYGFYVSLLASILGVILGGLIIGNAFLNMEMSYFEVPVYHIQIIPVVYILALITVLLITFITYLSCRKILKEPASQALRTESSVIKNYKLSNFEGLKNTSISTKWNLRDVFRNIGRSLMAIVGVCGCTMLIVCAFGMLDTMNSYFDWEFRVINNFKYKINLDSDLTNDEIIKIRDTYGDKTSQTLNIEFLSDDNKVASSITINDASEYLNITDHNKKVFEMQEDGIYITEKMASKNNLKVNDSITWHIMGEDKWYTSKIVGLYRDPQSQTISCKRAYIDSLNIDYKPDSLYTNKQINENLSFQGIESLENGMKSMLNTVKTIIVLLVVVSAILGSVIIYNLGVLSFSEKQYQFATLKVLGFKNKTIEYIYIKQNIWLAIVGIICGLPCGYFMIDYIFKSALGDNYDFPAVINIPSYVYAIIGSILVTIIVNYILAKKIKNIDMVTSLKANE